MSENRVNKLSVKAREVFGDKSKLKFSENPRSHSKNFKGS